MCISDYIKSRNRVKIASLVVPDFAVGVVVLLFMNKLRSLFKNVVNGSESFDAKLTLKSPPKIIGNLFSPLPKYFSPRVVYGLKERYKVLLSARTV